MTHSSTGGRFATPFCVTLTFTAPHRFIRTPSAPQGIVRDSSGGSAPEFPWRQAVDRLSVADLAGPEQAEAFAVTADHGLGLDDHEGERQPIQKWESRTQRNRSATVKFGGLSGAGRRIGGAVQGSQVEGPLGTGTMPMGA